MHNEQCLLEQNTSKAKICLEAVVYINIRHT